MISCTPGEIEGDIILLPAGIDFIQGNNYNENNPKRKEFAMTDVVAALIWEDGKFLACQRPAYKARGLLWEFVGGKVEAGETPQNALIRECREELAVTVEVQDVFMEVIHEYPDLTVRLILFNARIAEGIPQLLEHNDIRWVRPDQIDELPFCPADKEILEKIKTMSTI